MRRASDFFPSHYAIMILGCQKVGVLTLINGVLISWYSTDAMLFSVTSSRLQISFGCLPSIDLEELFIGLKASLSNLSIQPSGQNKECSCFLTLSPSFCC